MPDSDYLYDIKGNKAIPNGSYQFKQGKDLRKTLPREELGMFEVLPRDPVKIIAEQDLQRLPDLRQLRHDRMAQSPFTFYRGSARLMAHDLAQGPTTGLNAVICGDAHLSNLGFYASPERRLVFDLNDFDEAAVGPWEWDVKRLVTSFIIGALDRGFEKEFIEEIALECAQSYRETMRLLATKPALERFYYSVDNDAASHFGVSSTRNTFSREMNKAYRRTSAQAVEKITVEDELDRRVFVEDPPVLTHIEAKAEQGIREDAERYLASASPAIRQLASKFVLTDIARRVVGVGSVGTRCYIVLLTSAEHGSLILQVKEALQSVVAEFAPKAATYDSSAISYGTNGERVVVCQQILQAVSDPFLGSFASQGRDYYVRQFRDMKGSVELDRLSIREYLMYADACGILLARAHAQSFPVHYVAGYLGKSDVFDKAMVKWGTSYAKQVNQDYELFIAS